MPDDPKPSAQPDSPSGAVPAGVEPPAPAGPSADADALARENQELRERLSTYDATLRALAQRPPEPQQPAYGTPPVQQQPAGETELIRRIAARTGQDEATVAAYFPMLRSTVEELAQPVVSSIIGLADRVNETRARMTVKDFEAVEVEAKKVIQSYRNQGVYLDWEQAAEIARTRLGPQLAAQAAARAQQAQTAQAGQATQVAAERSIGATRAIPGGQPGRPSLAEIHAMPRGPEKEDLLTQLLEGENF
ncbi:MAG: hypothetical protein E6J45_13030 [Chloroflexi bacterium]|nr:MAG: hypothetical protein E6J45_13030 [Chloroflexota bacterium]